jgi:hypothetical protein
MGADMEQSVRFQLTRLITDLHHKIFVKAERYYGEQSDQLVADFNAAAELDGLGVTTDSLLKNANILTFSICCDLHRTLQSLKKAKQEYLTALQIHSASDGENETHSSLVRAKFKRDTVKEVVGFYILQLCRAVAITNSSIPKTKEMEDSLKKIEEAIDGASRLVTPPLFEILSEISKDLKVERTN